MRRTAKEESQHPNYFLDAPVPSSVRSRSPRPSPSHSHAPSLAGSPVLLPYDTSRTNSPVPGFKPLHPPAPRPSLLSLPRRRPRTFCAVVLFALAIWSTLRRYEDTLVLLRFKARDWSFEEGWRGCGLRKKPLVFVRAADEVAVVWETNCDRRTALEWSVEPRRGPKGAQVWTRAEVKMIKMEDATDSHFVHQAVVGRLAGGESYAYRLRMLPEGAPASSSAGKTLAKHSFKWQQSTSSKGGPTTIHLAAVADNQYNVRTFHRVLLSLLRHGRKHHSLRAPPLLLHAGDQVQNPHNLAQWQTDFWDAMTSSLPIKFGQQTPILLARGNHDWDKSGVNAYTGGSPPRREWEVARGGDKRENHPGTYMSYFPHERVRMLVLDANLAEGDQAEQEEWLEWEMARPEWKDASLRLVMVHVSPFIEFWDTTAWTKGKESAWSAFVRHKLTPLLSAHGATLVLSGHQHAYSRGFLPQVLHRSYTSVNSSCDVMSLAKASAAERSWEKKARLPGQEAPRGTVYTIFGGAGGTLDEDRVEHWAFYERSVRGKYHFVWMKLTLGQKRREAHAVDDTRRVYVVPREKGCAKGEEEVSDALEWDAVGIDGQPIDQFVIVAPACQARKDGLQ